MWLQPKDLYKGSDIFPPLSYQKQVELRKKNEIKFIKIGGLIYYKKQWIEEYLERNIRTVKDPTDANR